MSRFTVLGVLLASCSLLPLASSSSGEPLTISPIWSVEGVDPGGSLGASVCTAGDVNGDGFSDLVVGAPNAGVGEEGRVSLFLGSPEGVATAAAWTADGGAGGAHLGASVAPAGDVNGDGFADVIAGAPGYHASYTGEGRALLFLGGSEGLSADPAWSMAGRQEGIRFGICVAGAGDVNADGFDDVIVGADGYDGGQTDEGRAFLFLGRATGLAGDAVWTSEGDETGARQGICVAGAGDVDADGFADLLVGATGAEPAGAGKARLYRGNATGASLTASWVANGPQAGAAFGASVAAAGDLNGDGYADIVVGSPGYDAGAADAGAAFVYFGSASGLPTLASWTVAGDLGGARWGSSVATAGDVDGDGYADLIVGAPFEVRGGIATGAAFVFLGSAAGPGATPAWSGVGGLDPSEFGSSVSSAGDVDGDGFGDVIVGAPRQPGGRGEEGGASAYGGSASPLATTPNWTKFPDFTGGFLGFVATSAGDVNGDGFSDLLVSSPFYCGAEVLVGRVWLHLGSRTGVQAAAAWDEVGYMLYSYFGYSTAGAGDVNGDGFDDVIVGAHYYENVGQGKAYLYLGSSTGLSTTPAWTGGSREDQLDSYGYSVAGAGDVNGDGFADMIVGCFGCNHPEPDEGRIFVYYGSSSGPSSQASWTADSNEEGAEMGWSVASAGDVNGDGFSDVIAGANRKDNGIDVDAGAAYLYCGGSSGLQTSPAWTAFGEVGGSLFGNTVASAGDVNGDGFSDVLVTAPAHGWVYLFLGSASGLGQDPFWVMDIRPSQMGWVFDTNVAAAGDVNGDGFGDIVIGDPWQSGGGGRGQARIYLGSVNGPGEEPFWTGHSTAYGLFGHFVASAGDVNGDGFSDVAIGDPWADQYPPGDGRAYVYLGNGGDGLARTPAAWNVGGTAPVALRGMTDSPYSFRMRALGRTPAGRGDVRLETEVKPLGEAFDGAAIRGGVERPTEVPQAGIGSVVPLDDLLPPDLDPSTAYRWRTRIASRSPFFPHTPWMSPQGNSPTEIDLRTRGAVTADADVRQEPPGAIVLDAARPNPFTDQVRLGFSLKTRARIRISVNELTGRRIGVISDGMLDAGDHAIVWDGRIGGRSLSSGAYMVRFATSGAVRSVKVTLAR